MFYRRRCTESVKITDKEDPDVPCSGNDGISLPPPVNPAPPGERGGVKGDQAGRRRFKCEVEGEKWEGGNRNASTHTLIEKIYIPHLHLN